MAMSICGIDCTKCELSNTCNGCAETNGHPFGGECIVALCCQRGEKALCEFKAKLISAFNSLNIEYTLPGGQTVKLWDDNKIYLGNQLCKQNSDRCYGLAADEKYMMVCESGYDGSDAQIVVFRRWN